MGEKTSVLMHGTPATCLSWNTFHLEGDPAPGFGIVKPAGSGLSMQSQVHSYRERVWATERRIMC